MRRRGVEGEEEEEVSHNRKRWGHDEEEEEEEDADASNNRKRWGHDEEEEEEEEEDADASNDRKRWGHDEEDEEEYDWRRDNWGGKPWKQERARKRRELDLSLGIDPETGEYPESNREEVYDFEGDLIAEGDISDVWIPWNQHFFD